MRYILPFFLLASFSLSAKSLGRKYYVNFLGHVDKGNIQTRFLSNKRPKCLQEKYPKFYLGLDLDITEMYFWGRLYDQYFQGRSKIK